MTNFKFIVATDIETASNQSADGLCRVHYISYAPSKSEAIQDAIENGFVMSAEDVVDCYVDL